MVGGNAVREMRKSTESEASPSSIDSGLSNGLPKGLIGGKNSPISSVPVDLNSTGRVSTVVAKSLVDPSEAGKNNIAWAWSIR